MIFTNNNRPKILNRVNPFADEILKDRTTTVKEKIKALKKISFVLCDDETVGSYLGLSENQVRGILKNRNRDRKEIEKRENGFLKYERS